jgi:hypothetical protein
MGFSMVIAAWGRGLMCACVPPPPRQIACRSPKTRVKNAGWGLDFERNMSYAVGARVMAVSMVIAAWGEGVKVCLCPPSPSSDCWLFAQNARKKRWLGSLDALPLTARISVPLPHA